MIRPSKAQLKLEAKWVGKRVIAKFTDFPQQKGNPLVKCNPEHGVVTCICDNSADLEGGDSRWRSKPTGFAMIRLVRPSAQLEYEIDIKLLELVEPDSSK